jgi:hypothetical protein
MMPPRRINQRLRLDEVLLQTSDQNQPPFQQPSTQTLPTIVEAAEPTFDNIPEVQLQQATISTTATIVSQGNEGDQHLNTNPLPPPSQVHQGEAEFDLIEVQDWDEAEEEEAEADESRLIRVQQEIERLQQEQESIMKRQEAAQHVEARRQHINRKRKASRIAIYCWYPPPTRAKTGTTIGSGAATPQHQPTTSTEQQHSCNTLFFIKF